MNKTQNFGMSLPDLSNNADINVLNENFNNIDKGLAPFFIATTTESNVYKIDTGLNKTSLENGYCIRVAVPENSTGEVNILIDTLKVPVRKSGGGSVNNFKANSVYSLTYYNSVFILTSSGGGDDVSFTSDKLLEGYSANNSDGEKITGTMKNNGVISQNIGINGNITLPNGYYDSIKISQNIATKGAETYTPSISDQVIDSGQYLSGSQTILGDENLKSENILKGTSIFGVEGGITLESIGNGIKNYMCFKNSKVNITHTLPSNPSFIVLIIYFDSSLIPDIFFCNSSYYNVSLDISWFYKVGENSKTELAKYDNVKHEIKVTVDETALSEPEMKFHCFWV